MNSTHAVVVQQHTYEVLSASAASYSFIGQRLYHTFDQLIEPCDLPVFHQQMQQHSGEQFFLHLMDNKNNPLLYLAAIKPSVNSNAVVIELVPVASLPDMLKQLDHEIGIKNSILSIYDDEYFAYDDVTKRFRIFRTLRFDQTIVDTELYCFFERIQGYAVDDDKEKVQQFCNDFTAQKSSLYLLAEGNLLGSGHDANITLIKGISVTDHGQYTGTVGVIHYGTRRKPGIQRSAERDSLTGVLTKGEITSAAINLINQQKTQDISLAIIDFDDFKQVNDTFGHMAGDKALKYIAAIIEDSVGSEGMVGRIGGDEFMVIFYRMHDMEEHRELLRSIKNRVSAAYPANVPNAPSVTLSIGCASYPKDAGNYADVFRLADYAMYRAKDQGRNRYVIFDRDKHGDPTHILSQQTSGKRISNRGNMSVGDIIGAMAARVFEGEGEQIDQLLEQAVLDLGIQRMMLYVGTPWHAVCTAGEKRPDTDLINQTIAYLDDPDLQSLYDHHGILMCYDIERLAAKGMPVYRLLHAQGILSFIHIRTTDADGHPVILSLESVNKRVTWNEYNIPYYTLFKQILHCYHLT